IIPSIILENLPTFNSAFCFDERLRLLETTFSEYSEEERIMIKKDPPLDQTEGLKDKKKEQPEWFSQPRKPPSPDRDWNITVPAAQGDVQS
nr:hypothetical protein [Tanacetum cinerariifolium]